MGPWTHLSSGAPVYVTGSTNQPIQQEDLLKIVEHAK